MNEDVAREQIKHILGDCMCSSTDQGCWFWKNCGDLSENETSVLQETAIVELIDLAKIAALAQSEVAKQVLEARIDELDRYFVGTPNLYYDQRVARLRKKLTKLTRAQEAGEK